MNNKNVRYDILQNVYEKIKIEKNITTDKFKIKCYNRKFFQNYSSIPIKISKLYEKDLNFILSIIFCEANKLFNILYNR